MHNLDPRNHTLEAGAAPGLCVRGGRTGGPGGKAPGGGPRGQSPLCGGQGAKPPEAVGFCMLSVSQNPLKSTIIIRN